MCLFLDCLELGYPAMCQPTSFKCLNKTTASLFVCTFRICLMAISSVEREAISLFTASKRSLGQGNVFTRVCHSVHRGVVGSASQGGLYSGGSASGGRDWVDPFPIRYYGIRSTSGRYAFYWNAVLFTFVFWNKCNRFTVISVKGRKFIISPFYKAWGVIAGYGLYRTWVIALT